MAMPVLGEEQELDNQNQQRSLSLAKNVSHLRSLALDIENEAYEHNRLLDGMDSEFLSGNHLLSGSMNRVKGILSSGRQNRKVMCYMVAFTVLFVILVFYLLSKTISHG